MKTIKFLFVTLAVAILFNSCSDDNDDPVIVQENPLSEMNRLTTLSANNHTIELYSENTDFTVGYNMFYYRIKDESTDTYISNAQITVNPLMHMTSMTHSCPKSAISKIEDDTVYMGYAVFQMPGNADEYWELNMEYTLDGETYAISERIDVGMPEDGFKRVHSFIGADDKRYIVAMMPFEPEVKVNAFSAMVFQMENMMNFPIVEGYTLGIDPRMPSMGNHSSPNNENLTFDSSTGKYNGKLSLTMTGYWKINLQLFNKQGDVLKGEPVTDENEASSLYFELEF